MNNRRNPSSDYLTYKKSRMNPSRVQRVEKRIEKVKRVCKLSFITFCLIFICVVIFIKKYTKPIDIEYGRHGAEISKGEDNQSLNDNYFDGYDADKRTIDKRLLLIQEEENAPSESRVLPQDRDKNEVMNLEHFEKLKSNMDDDIDLDIDNTPPKKTEETKPVVQSVQNTNVQNNLPQQNETSNVVPEAQGNFAPIEFVPKANIKVLIGKYSTFDEAKTAQTSMKNSKARIAPFIRKVDDVYCLQIGSYSNMDVARGVAGTYSRDGYDVWIYQQ